MLGILQNAYINYCSKYEIPDNVLLHPKFINKLRYELNDLKTELFGLKIISSFDIEEYDIIFFNYYN